MAYDETVADRVRKSLSRRGEITERKMFGGLAFLLRGHMVCGVIGDELMVRVGPDLYEKALARPYARQMDFTGKPLRGFVYVGRKGFAATRDLGRWLDDCTKFARTLPAKKKR